ncbi:MAG: hypothetical protein ABS63_08650 [Microbacterium sp. SCN 70-27]|uniref:ATP-binding protein n=1 Tax=unclassified Microbacterium TaxID=2609290 RepID=UPI000869FE44|nr:MULTISPECIES: ATP-binding protein [unclassified Microbacterium]MBN9225468.1 ATP-binding protein [Microbacterium sp.]ODT27387.1 MAG: hypothetical protein ABS63_08650 [Microbacterium sp. SCN 70-27]
MGRVTVKAAADHLDRFITSPRSGLLELVWNALDADADEVRIQPQLGGVGGVESLTVTDDGTGLSADRAESEFGALGGSWKRLAQSTEKGRSLHGRLGGGRFAAYGLGHDVRWESINDATTGRKQVVVKGARSSAHEFDVEVSDSDAAKTGTTVTIASLTDATVRYLDSARPLEDLTKALAVYITQYQPKVFLADREIRPEDLIEATTPLDIEVSIGGQQLTIPMSIIEWKQSFDRGLYLCDERGVALHEMKPGIQAPGQHFTAYVKWSGFAERVHDLMMEGAMGEPISSVIDAAQDALRKHFKRRRDERYTRMIESWKTEKSYPFSPEEEDGSVSTATRELFDIVAIAAAPAVEKTDVASRKLSLRLLKEAIENSPETVHTLLQEVVNLSEQDAEDLKSLVDKTSLAGVISSAKTISDRLEFLASLEAIINEPDLKKVVKERSQLHRILAKETWVFREEYALVGDDQTLRTVLRKNLEILGNEVATVESVDAAEVTDPDGHVRVIDLMLSAVIKSRESDREHIVIELKRPSQHIGQDEIRQIENYAETVAGDTRFAETDTKWEFWIIGDKIADNARLRTRQSGRERGVTLESDSPRIKVRAVTWAQVIRDAKHRLQFVRESMDYDPTTEAGLEYLKVKHAEYLPDVLKPDADAGSQQAVVTAEGRRDGANLGRVQDLGHSLVPSEAAS